MSQPKAQTIQQRFGFVDADLKTPKHDEIMTWIDNNAETIVKKLIGYQEEWDYPSILKKKAEITGLIEKRCEYLKDENRSEEYRARQKNEKDFWLQYSLGEPPSKPSDIEVQATWEMPIKNGNFMIGFIDMQLEAEIPHLDVTCVEQFKSFYTLENPPRWIITHGISQICIEAKTTMSSLGELIRQVNMYRGYYRAKYCVIAPDSIFAEKLVEQGIKFIKFPTMEIWK